MPISIKMPALSPTMEEGTLAKWMVKEGDTVEPGDLLAEIETDKATMEFEAVDEGVIGKILVEEGTEGVKVGTAIAEMEGEGDDSSSDDAKAEKPDESPKTEKTDDSKDAKAAEPAKERSAPAEAPPAPSKDGDRIAASPLARRIAEQKGIDLSSVSGSGPNGRIVKADIEAAKPGAGKSASASSATEKPPLAEMSDDARKLLDDRIPHSVEKLSGMRKTIARRLTESKQQVPHIYLTVDIRLDKLLAMRSEINAALEPQGIKVSVNDLLIKALGKALIAVPKCNVAFAGSELISYERADVSVAVSVPAGLITPIIANANGKSVSEISTEMKDLAGRAKDGKLKPEEFQGGTASLSNMGMFGIKQFEAVINPPQGMIMAIGAGEQRPHVIDGELGVATVMSATGSFDHRAIDGADGAQLMKAFKEFVEAPMGMLA